MRAGDWEYAAKMPNGAPLITHFCLNDDTWIKSVTQNPVCKIEGLSVTSKGASYTMDCPTMKGSIELIFDGLEHMAGKASITMTRNGKTSNSQSSSDWRWKGDACNSADVNLKKKSTP